MTTLYWIRCGYAPPPGSIRDGYKHDIYDDHGDESRRRRRNINWGVVCHHDQQPVTTPARDFSRLPNSYSTPQFTAFVGPFAGVDCSGQLQLNALRRGPPVLQAEHSIYRGRRSIPDLAAGGVPGPPGSMIQ